MDALQVEQGEQSLLLGVTAGETDAGGNGARPLPRLGLGEIGDRLDPGQGLDDRGEPRGACRVGASDLAVKKRAQEEGEDAVSRVDPDLLIGPVEQRTPTAKMRALPCDPAMGRVLAAAALHTGVDSHLGAFLAQAPRSKLDQVRSCTRVRLVVQAWGAFPSRPRATNA